MFGKYVTRSLLVVAIGIALSSPILQRWIVDSYTHIEGFNGTFSQFQSHVAARRFMSKLPDNILNDESKHNYLMSVTDNLDTLNKFHQNYCISSDKNPIIYGNDLAIVCKTMNEFL